MEARQEKLKERLIVINRPEEDSLWFKKISQLLEELNQTQLRNKNAEQTH